MWEKLVVLEEPEQRNVVVRVEEELVAVFNYNLK